MKHVESLFATVGEADPRGKEINLDGLPSWSRRRNLHRLSFLCSLVLPPQQVHWSFCPFAPSPLEWNALVTPAGETVERTNIRYVL